MAVACPGLLWKVLEALIGAGWGLAQSFTGRIRRLGFKIFGPNCQISTLDRFTLASNLEAASSSQD